MNEALLPVVNGLEFLSPPLPQEKQETLVRRVLEQGAAENLPGAQKASTAVPAIVPDAAAPPEKRRGGFRRRGRLWAVLAAALALCACTAVIGAVQYFAPMTRRTGADAVVERYGAAYTSKEVTVDGHTMRITALLRDKENAFVLYDVSADSAREASRFVTTNVDHGAGGFPSKFSFVPLAAGDTPPGAVIECPALTMTPEEMMYSFSFVGGAPQELGGGWYRFYNRGRIPEWAETLALCVCSEADPGTAQTILLELPPAASAREWRLKDAAVEFCAGIYYPEFKLYGASTDLKHTECAPQHLKMRVETVRISPVSVRISGSGADPNMAARQLPPPPEEAMNETFYHYLRNAELVFQNGSRITIYGDQLTEWRVTPDGARGKSEFVAGYMLKDILDPEAVAAIEIDGISYPLP